MVDVADFISPIAILPAGAAAAGHAGALASRVGISTHSAEFKELTTGVKVHIVTMSNRAFCGIVGAPERPHDDIMVECARGSSERECDALR